MPEQRGEGTQPWRVLGRRGGVRWGHAVHLPRRGNRAREKYVVCTNKKTQRRRSTQLLSHFLGKAVKVQLTESEKQDNKELTGARVRRASAAACSSPGRAHLVAAEVVCFSLIAVAGLHALLLLCITQFCTAAFKLGPCSRRVYGGLLTV